MPHFESLPQEKKTLILNAGFSCFGKNGYKKTSISDIAHASSISKASVFQYFGSKPALYAYLFKFACDAIVQKIPSGGDDFFETLEASIDIKIQVMNNYPGMYDFLASTVGETDAHVASILADQSHFTLGSALQTIFANVNWDKFKPSIDHTMIFNTVKWISDGYVKENINVKYAITMRTELSAYLYLIKKSFYKEEYL